MPIRPENSSSFWSESAAGVCLTGCDFTYVLTVPDQMENKSQVAQMFNILLCVIISMNQILRIDFGRCATLRDDLQKIKRS